MSKITRYRFPMLKKMVGNKLENKQNKTKITEEMEFGFF